MFVIATFLSDIRNIYLTKIPKCVRNERNVNLFPPLLNWNPSFQFASLSSDLANRLQK